MIRGIHGLFYSSDPDATRAFFRDQVKLPGSDIGDGWWIFDLPEPARASKAKPARKTAARRATARRPSAKKRR